jgi:FixJ family two-component response regulator
MEIRPHISVVGDDESVRESLPDLLRELGLQLGPSRRRTSFLHPFA